MLAFFETIRCLSLMALSKASPHVPAYVLHIGCVHRDPGLLFVSPECQLYGDLKNCVISGGSVASKPVPIGSSKLSVVHFDAKEIPGIPAFILDGGGTFLCQYPVSVLERKGAVPFDSLSDLFLMQPSNLQINLLKAGDCMKLFPGDVVIYQTGYTALQGDINFRNQLGQLNMKTDFGILILLPEIEDMKRFQEKVVGNPNVIREIRDYVDECVGCWDAVFNLATNKTDCVWSNDRSAAFRAKTYDHLVRLDSIYEGDSYPSHSVANGGGSKKRKPAAKDMRPST